jgi:competence protein ComEC
MRSRLARRPLVIAALCCLAGSAAGSAAPVPTAVWGAGAVVMALVVCWKRGMALFSALVLLFAMESSALMRRPMPAAAEGAFLSGEVCLTPDVSDARTVLTLSGATVNGEALDWKVRVYAYEQVDAGLGDRVSMTVDTWQPSGRVNPYGFDFDAWCRRNGVLCATMKAGTARVTPGALSARSLLRFTRARLVEAVDEAFPARQAPLVRALILGDRSDLPEEMSDDFRDAGLAHILSVSGLHVTCLALALDRLLSRFLSRRAVFIVMAPLLALYAAVVGFSDPIVRAVVMYLGLRLAPLTGRPGDSLSGLAAALILMLAVNPLAPSDAGFILSFSAMAGLILLSRPLERLLRVSAVPRRLRCFPQAFCASVAASVAILPASANLFGAAQPYGPLVNVVAVPLASIALPLSFLAVPVQMLWPAMGALAARPASLLLDLLTGIASFAANLPRSTVPVGYFALPLAVMWGLGVYLLSDHAGATRRQRLVALALLPAALTLSAAVHALNSPKGLAFDFLSVGNADASVVYAEGQAYLVDAGEAGGTAAQYLAQTGAPLKAVFLTHPHDDHIGGAGEVVKLYPDATVYVPECWARIPGVEASEARSALTGPLVPLKAGDVVPLSENAIARVMYPPEGLAPKDANGASLVLLISMGDASALLTGDLPAAALLPDVPDVDLLKAPHHGADIADAEFLLRAASPTVVAVSASGRGHPSEALLKRAERLGIPVFATSDSGMVRVNVAQGGAALVTPFISKEEK